MSDLGAGMDWQDRAIDERAELEKRIYRLKGHLSSMKAAIEKCGEKPAQDDGYVLKNTQLVAMETYRETLTARIKRF